MSDSFDLHVFAREWVAAWNAGDIDAIVGHYNADAVFVSPRALEITRKTTVTGRESLQRYWASVLEAVGGVDFSLRDLAWDPARRVLVLRYISRRGDIARNAVEVFEFDDTGGVIAGEALYGASLE